ncbi:MAG: hypothetical protein JXN10_08280 [Clostridia bacterium]|nr:hypothetical protein [Clostridia bacterium]MBN2883512.1 hypothetical protein [Clostridia bacterium]
MKKSRWRVMSVLVMAAMVMVIGAGCGGGNVGDDLAMDLGEKLAEDLTGGEISTDNEWPEEMPENVPEMKKGIVVNSTAILIGGKKNISISMEDVSEQDFTSYVSDVEAAGFNLIISNQSGGIDSKTFGQGENALSLQYASKSEELIISYTGD